MPGPISLKRIKRVLARKRMYRALANRKAVWRRDHPHPGPSLAVLIVGCQRSGTTMLGRILEKLMPVDCFHETDRRAFLKNMRTRGAAVRRALVERSDAQAVLFKPICDSHLASDMLAEHGGDAKAVWIYRYWRDVTNSNVKIWSSHWKEVYGDLLSGADTDWGWRHEGIPEPAMAVLRELFSASISEQDAASLKWLVRNESYFEQGLHDRPDVLPVRYETLVTDPAGQFARVCKFLEIPFDPSVVEQVFDKSIGKDQAPPEDPRVVAVCDAMYQRLQDAESAWDARFAPDAAPTGPTPHE